MGKQLIISVGREFGSGGHEIAEMLAKKFDLKLYDKNLLQNIAQEKEVDAQNIEKYDEVPRNMLLSRTVKGYSNSMEENVAQMQFDYLKRKAEEGESFVVVGRCAEVILKDNPALISIFVVGDFESKIERIMRVYDLSRSEAELVMARQNKKRKGYHNYYCKEKWGDSRNYDITVNSSRLGEAETAELLADYISKRQNAR